jgi:hypothetical protein
MANKKLVSFIKEARKRGFGDTTIRNALTKHGWPLQEIEKAFTSLAPRYKSKNQVTMFLDTEVMELLEKRAKKNMFNVSEQIEDILRRSVISQKKKKYPYEPKIDDALVSVFSRRKSGRKKKKKTKKKK